MLHFILRILVYLFVACSLSMLLSISSSGTWSRVASLEAAFLINSISIKTIRRVSTKSENINNSTYYLLVYIRVINSFIYAALKCCRNCLTARTSRRVETLIISTRISSALFILLVNKMQF